MDRLSIVWKLGLNLDFQLLLPCSFVVKGKGPKVNHGKLEIYMRERERTSRRKRRRRKKKRRRIILRTWIITLLAKISPI